MKRLTRIADQFALQEFLVNQKSHSYSVSRTQKILSVWNVSHGQIFSNQEIAHLSRLLSDQIRNHSCRDELGSLLITLPKTKKLRDVTFLSRIAMAMGLFEIGYNLWFSSANHVRDFGLEARSNREKLEGLKAAVAINDLQSAASLTRTLLKVKAKRISPTVDIARSYLRLCGLDFDAHGMHDAGHLENYSKLGISNLRVCVVGPSFRDEKLDYAEGFQGIVARRIGVGASTFGEFDGFNGQLNLAYTDNLFVDYVRAGGEITNLQNVTSISLNQPIGDLHQYAIFRIARNPSPLFYSGAANKIPLMLFDLLIENPNSLEMIGVNFFLSKTPYSESNRDVSHDGLRINEFGSTSKGRFETCNSLAAHNPFTNRNFVRNLLANPSFAPDFEGKKILNLPDEVYARELDNLYGVTSA